MSRVEVTCFKARSRIWTWLFILKVHFRKVDAGDFLKNLLNCVPTSLGSGTASHVHLSKGARPQGVRVQGRTVQEQ